MKNPDFITDILSAREVQKNLLPSSTAQTECCSIATKYLPHHQLGGDTFDIFEINQDKYSGTALSIADVSGKGLPAALLMANFQAALRMLLKYETNYRRLVDELNASVYNVSKGDRFVSLFLALISMNTADIRYINFGHNPPLLKQNNTVKALKKGTIVLGAFPDIPSVQVGKEKWTQDSKLLAYTDGLVEAQNKQGEAFGVERIRQFMVKEDFDNPKELNKALLCELEKFTGTSKLIDDVTLLTTFSKI